MIDIGMNLNARDAVRVSLAFALLVTSCRREERRFREMPPASTATNVVEVTSLQPGPVHQVTETRIPYQYNAYAISEGKMLFNQFNCVGCHSNGGGGMGPPLMDDKWIYGYEPEHVFSTIVQGRPNGMPSFGGRIPDYQVWQLAAYVRSMSGYARPDAAPGRSDHMRNKPPEHSTTQQGQTTSRTPPP